MTPQRAVERRDGKETVYPLEIPKPGFKMDAFADRDGYLWIGEFAVQRVGKGTQRRFAEADGLPRPINHSSGRSRTAASGSPPAAAWPACGRRPESVRDGTLSTVELTPALSGAPRKDTWCAKVDGRVESSRR